MLGRMAVVRNSAAEKDALNSPSIAGNAASSAVTKVCNSGDHCMFSLGLFHGCFGILGGVIAVSEIAPPPVLLQMILYTLPILYIGSHLSLKQSEVDSTTGQRLNRGETMNRTDALLFPVFGSIALFSLYISYKWLGSLWVNRLLTLYLSGVGLVAFAETAFIVIKPLAPAGWLDDSFLVIQLGGPLRLLNRLWGSKEPKINPTVPDDSNLTNDGKLADHDKQKTETSTKDQPVTDTPTIDECVWRFSPLIIVSYLSGAFICILWLITKHWTLHNMLAVAFCVQAVAIVSVGSFSIATILLCGLFVYDVFWVFGTEVMVTVAKSFEGPAKLIFPVQLVPWQHSILGLGDIVIPGVFISMCLRFDSFIHSQPGANSKTDVNIHQRFPKFYFWVVVIFYELGLLTTGIIMLAVQHPQPALLYLVPYCILSLFGAAALKGRVKDVLAYCESEDAKLDAPNKND